MKDLRYHAGCFAGLVAGDVLCAGHEGGLLERLLWAIIGKSNGKCRYTDDSQMSFDIAHVLLSGNYSQDLLAQEFAANYRWSRGYGPAAGGLLKQVKAGRHWSELNKAKFKNGSWGNGAAMRAPVIGLFCAGKSLSIKKFCVEISEITHANPLAIDGAFVIAALIAGMGASHLGWFEKQYCNGRS